MEHMEQMEQVLSMRVTAVPCRYMEHGTDGTRQVCIGLLPEQVALLPERLHARLSRTFETSTRAG